MMLMASGVTARGASRGRRPRSTRIRLALGESCRPAPASSSRSAFSRTMTRKPFAASESAAVTRADQDVALFGRAHTTGPIAAAFTQLARPLDEIPFYTRDVARAKQLLADAGYADGMQLQLLITPVLAATIPIAELMKTQLAEVGINIEIVQRDLATIVDEYSVQGTAQLAISWWAGYSDPYLILLTQSSGDFAPILGISDPKVDELIASRPARSSRRPASRCSASWKTRSLRSAASNPWSRATTSLPIARTSSAM